MTAPALDVDPWLVREPRVDLTALATSESVFTLSNGYLGIPGTLDEVGPFGMRGTHLSGVHETHPLSCPEGGFGHPGGGQALVTVLDGTPLRLLVDGVPLDVREVAPEVHERTLDLRPGTLDRRVRWRTPSGTTMEVTSRRLVSLAERSVCAVRFEVRAVDGEAHVVVRSELAGGEATPTGLRRAGDQVPAGRRRLALRQQGVPASGPHLLRHHLHAVGQHGRRRVAGLGLVRYFAGVVGTSEDAVVPTLLIGPAFIAVTGFENAANVAEETIDPSRAFPRALIGGRVTAGAVHVLVSLAAALAVPIETLSGNT